jgi:hypothetical protein
VQSLGDSALIGGGEGVTRNKGFKRLVRARASVTGERYTAAHALLLRQRKEAVMVPVTCEVTTRKVSGEQLQKMREMAATAAARLSETHPLVRVEPPSEEEQPVLLLKEIDGSRSLPIFCGPFEATSIALAQEGVETERPMTHDLLRDVVTALGEAREVRITELRGSTFFAELVVTDSAGEQRTVSCRPSDGIALAVRAGIPILVAEPLFVEGNVGD